MYVQFEDESNTCNVILKYMCFGDEQFKETVSGYCSMTGFCDDKDSSLGFMVAAYRVISLTFRLLMSYIGGAPILDVSRSHTTTQHSR